MQTISVMNCIGNVIGIYVFKYFTNWALNKEYLIAPFKHCPLLCCQMISGHFCENRVTLYLTVIKLRCIKLCAFFSGTPCIVD